MPAIYDPAAPLCVGTNAAATDPFLPGGPAANDETSCLFLILRIEKVPAKIFCDPYTDELESTPDPAVDATVRSNFTDYTCILSFYYADLYRNAAAAQTGYHLTNKMNPSLAVAADLNPGTLGQNSRNHERRAQDVLFADNHVEWEKTIECGVNTDDIYSNNSGVVQGSPVDATDSVLLPVDR